MTPWLTRWVHRQLYARDLFLAGDFLVKWSDSKTKFVAIYRGDVRWVFETEIEGADPVRAGYTWTATPGRIRVTDSGGGTGLEGLGSAIGAWLDNVYDAVVNEPAMRKIAEHEEVLARLEAMFTEEQAFSEEEIEGLRRQIDDVLAELDDLRRSISDERSERERVATQFARDLAALREQLATKSKRAWVLSFVNRAVRASKDPAVRQMTLTIVNALRPFLPAQVEQILPVLGELTHLLPPPGG